MKAAFVTGAGGDIGQATVRLLHASGWQVAATDVASDNMAGLADLRGVFATHCDITSSKSVRGAVDRALEKFGSIDLLVNNAGGISASSLRTVTETDWLRDLDLNLTGHWRCINALQEHMIERGSGVIINVASVNGLGIFGHPGYSAAKAGLIHLTRFIAVEFGKHGLRSVAICPGSVRTQAWDERAERSPDILQAMLDWYPSRRICEPVDVAKSIVHAASDDARMMNGAIIALDGGLSAGTERVASLFTGGNI